MNTLKLLKERAKKVKPIELEEGLTVHVRKLTAAEVTSYAKANVDAKNEDDRMNAAAMLIQTGTCEADGSPVFQNTDEVTSEIDSDTSLRLAKEIIAFNNLARQESQEGKKPDSPDSAETPNGCLPTGSV